MKVFIDFSIDVGESTDPRDIERDCALCGIASSASIACGTDLGHAGSELAARAILARCRETGTSAGAHPSYPDPANFGRVRMAMPHVHLVESIAEQTLWLAALARDEGVALRHVKPHGALYNEVADDDGVADAIVNGVRLSGLARSTRIFGLAGSRCLPVYRRAGYKPIHEAFADRRYEVRPGSAFPTLVPRDRGDIAVISSVMEIVEQTRMLLMRGEVRCTMPVASDAPTTARAECDSLCIHSDTSSAGVDVIKRAQLVRDTMISLGFSVRSMA
jgi:UPF0271 protein